MPMMNQSQQPGRIRMQGCLLSCIAPAGVLAGLDSVEDCMKDGDLRSYLGEMLLHEIMPGMGMSIAGVERLAMQVCRDMEQPMVRQPIASLMPGALRAWAQQALPFLLDFEARQDRVPPCLCLGLAMLILLFAGARQDAAGQWYCLLDGEKYPVEEDEEILSAFLPLSYDMAPDMLAYAVLSDRAIWEQDLRDIPGLEDLVADQLRDLQLIGLREALKKAATYWAEAGK